jgi:hypothetical protein
MIAATHTIVIPIAITIAMLCLLKSDIPELSALQMAQGHLSEQVKK